MKSDYITRDYFDASLRQMTQDIIGHFNRGQGEQNQRIKSLENRFIGLENSQSGMEGRLAGLEESVNRIELAIEDYLNTDQVVVTLVHKLVDDHHLALPRTSNLLAK